MTQPEDLNAQEWASWLALASIVTTVPAVLSAQLERDEDLSLPEFLALSMLSGIDSQHARMSELAVTASLSPSHMSRIVSRLESEGFVSRSMDPEDRRAVIVSLTGLGQAKLDTARPAHTRMLRSLLFDRLSSDQLAALVGIAESIIQDTGGNGADELQPSATTGKRNI